MRFGRQNVGRWGAIGLVAALLGICAGCGGSSLATVQGTVTFDGEPVNLRDRSLSSRPTVLARSLEG